MWSLVLYIFTRIGLFFFNGNHWDFSDKSPLLPTKPLFKNQSKFQIICETFLHHLSPLGAFSPSGILKTYWLYLHLLFLWTSLFFMWADFSSQTGSILFYFSVVFKGNLKADNLGFNMVLQLARHDIELVT